MSDISFDLGEYAPPEEEEEWPDECIDCGDMHEDIFTEDGDGPLCSECYSTRTYEYYYEDDSHYDDEDWD